MGDGADSKTKEWVSGSLATPSSWLELRVNGEQKSVLAVGNERMNVKVG